MAETALPQPRHRRSPVALALKLEPKMACVEPDQRDAEGSPKRTPPALLGPAQPFSLRSEKQKGQL